MGAPTVSSRASRGGPTLGLVVLVVVGSYLVLCPARVIEVLLDVARTLLILFLPFILVFVVLSMFGLTRGVGRIVGRATMLTGGMAAGSAAARRRSRTPRARPVLEARLATGSREVTVAVRGLDGGVQADDRLRVRGVRLGRRVRVVQLRNQQHGGRFLDLRLVATVVVLLLLAATPVAVAASC